MRLHALYARLLAPFRRRRMRRFAAAFGDPAALCVVDVVPRTLTPDQVEALDALRRQVQAQLELRGNLIDLEIALAERDRAEAAQLKLIGELRESLDNVNNEIEQLIQSSWGRK